MSIYIPYTYHIGWSNHQKHYYGVQYGKGCTPENLWKTYFTSSKYVNQFRENYGEPDIVEVRRTFETKEKAIEWEQKVLKRLGIPRNNKWMNKNVAGAFNLDEEIIALRAKKGGLTRKRKGCAAWNKGLHTGPNGTKGMVRSDETREKMRKPKRDTLKMGRYTRNQETREKIRSNLMGIRVWTNGVDEKKSKGSPGEGWYEKPKKTYVKKGRSNTAFKGVYWWNDGLLNKRSKVCPGDGWVKGYLNSRWKNRDVIG